jgi:protein ImuB
VAGVRTLVVWCPDWPVVAAGCPPEVPVAVVAANRVVAATQAARREGVMRGLRRREAQGRCPDLEVVAADPGRDARAFFPVVAVVESFTSGVEIVRPGLMALGTRGPSRYFGGDQALAARVAAAVDAATSGVAPGAQGCRVGVADGRFAAELAARSIGPGGRVVPVGEARAFLAPAPVTALPDPELAGLLTRLGLIRLGDLAALPAASVLARFGPAGAAAHRLARGLDERPLAARTPPPDLAVSAELDPPAERVDTAAFVARSLAAELHDHLGALGLACTRVAIEAETEHGEHLSRLWRHEGALGAAAIAERVRWQLDGWLSRGETSGGLTLLRLVPDEVRPDGGRQLGFWGGGADDGGIARTLARVQGLIGPGGVVTAVLGGGRDPADAVRLVPWGEPREPARPGPAHVPEPPAAGGPTGTEPPPPWPGRIPGPAPAVVHSPPQPIAVRDATGATVTVSGRGAVSAPPAELSVDGGPWARVEAWAGPWPLEERWWDGGRRRARFQLVTAGAAAYLVTRERGGWWVEATYD